MDKIINGVRNYYSNKITAHGSNHLGVDWNSKESQYLRFEQLVKVINKNDFSLLDYGCGYAEMINFLQNERFGKFNYTGYDISEEMLQCAKTLFENKDDISFISNLSQNDYDYVLASGVFNVKLNLANDQDWLNYILQCLNEMDRLSKSGFSFNALTKYSDKEYMKDYLYYADPIFLFDYCKKHFARNVALLHDYDLYEFTLIIRK